MHEKYTNLIGAELSRRDFLKFVGGGIVVLLGMHNLIDYLSQLQHNDASKAGGVKRPGYGVRGYGE